MRLRVLGEPGELARHPEDALAALADVAAADGAVREDWIEKALRSGGATQRQLPVDHDARFRFERELSEEAVGEYRRILARMRGAIAEHLDAEAASLGRRAAQEVRAALES